MLYSDKPLESPEQDKLGYTKFARLLAKSIISMTPTDGIVLSLYGEWGSGKSTIMKFVEYFLLKDKEFEQFERPVVYEFNPWWFTSESDLIKQFFGELEVVIGRLKFGEASKDIAKKVKLIGEKVSSLSLPGAWLAGILSNMIPEFAEQSIAALKKEVSHALQTQNRKILIVMDDIDRLQKHEMLQLFAVIKAVADFPNVIYLLAFDPNVVSKSLGSQGLHFLEKIVQVPFELPKPSQLKLLDYLVAEINGVVGNVPVELNIRGMSGAQSLIFDLVELLDTPRKVTRYINALRTTFPVLAPEIYPSDFILIEAIRVESPRIYRNLREYKGILTKTVENEKAEGSLRTLLEKESASLQSIVISLFPDFRRSGQSIFSPPVTRFTDRRISDPSSFDTYFQFALPDERVSKQTLNSLVELAAQNITPTDLIQEFSQGTSEKAEDAIVSLGLRISYSDFPPLTLRNILAAFLDVGDSFATFPRESIESSIHDRLIHLLCEIVKHMPPDDRLPTLQALLPKARAKYTAVRLTAVLVRQHYAANNIPQDVRILQSGEIPGLKSVAIPLVRAFVHEPEFWSYEFCLTGVRLWLDLEPDQAREWLVKVLANPDTYLKFLRKFIDPMGVAHGEVHLTDNLKDYFQTQDFLDITRKVQGFSGHLMSTSDSVLVSKVIDALQSELNSSII